MVLQIAIGSGLMMATIAFSGLCLWWVETRLRRHHDWLTREPHGPRLALLLFGAAVWVMRVLTFGVWLRALTFYGLGLFSGLEPCVYFSLVSYTTLGYGDLLLPTEWRLLGGMAAANGYVTFGILIASLSEALRQVRLAQIDRGSRRQK